MIFETQPFIRGARRQLPDRVAASATKLAPRSRLIERKVDADRHLLQPFMFQHTPGQRGNDLNLFPAGFDIHQRQFGDRKLFITNDNPFNSSGV